MPIKRRSAKARAHRITPEAIDAFKRGDEIALMRALGLKPWDMSPLETECPYAKGTSAALSWPKVCELRALLLEAVGE
jgi:hypothetical protein